MEASDISPDWVTTWHIDSQAMDFVPWDSGKIELNGNLGLTYTRCFISGLNQELLAEFEHRFRQVARHFPEITGEIKIGVTNSYRGLAMIEYHGKIASRKLSFPHIARKGLPSRYVIGHELMHISHAQRRDFPGSERATDIFALARLPPDLIDSAPVYLKVPDYVRRNWSHESIWPLASELAHSLAVDSIGSRGTDRRYIARWESAFDERIRAMIGSWPPAR